MNDDDIRRLMGKSRSDQIAAQMAAMAGVIAGYMQALKACGVSDEDALTLAMSYQSQFVEWSLTHLKPEGEKG